MTSSPVRTGETSVKGDLVVEGFGILGPIVTSGTQSPRDGPGLADGQVV